MGLATFVVEAIDFGSLLKIQLNKLFTSNLKYTLHEPTSPHSNTLDHISIYTEMYNAPAYTLISELVFCIFYYAPDSQKICSTPYIPTYRYTIKELRPLEQPHALKF